MTISYPVPAFTTAALTFCLLAGLMGCAQEDDSPRYSKFVKSETGPGETSQLTEQKKTELKPNSVNGSNTKPEKVSRPVVALKPGQLRHLRQLANRKIGNVRAEPKNVGETKVKPGVESPPIHPRAAVASLLEVKLLVKERKFRVEGPENAIRVNYDDINLLKVLNMEPVPPDAHKKFPDWLKNLNGKRIRIRGFMSPAFSAKGLKFFRMGRDNKACCFPARAKIYDLFPVSMRDGVTTDYILNRPFDVVGIFQIKPFLFEGEWITIYQIVDAVIVK